MPSIDLKSEIHSSYTTGLATWSGYRGQIKSLYDAAISKEDFNDHLIREYNKKIERLNQPTGLYISPFDGGGRFKGSSIATAKISDLRFVMSSIDYGIATVTINGISKTLSGAGDSKTFTFSEISKLIFSSNVNINGVVSSPEVGEFDIDIDAGDVSKISNFTYGIAIPSNFSFTILYDQNNNSDTLDFLIAVIPV